MDFKFEKPGDVSLEERFLGALVGLACGDAVGTTVEFKPPGSFTPVTDMVGGGPFRLVAGQFTDDTSMALCMAESLIKKKTFDGSDIMGRFVRWWREGHLSSNGRCFDIGITTAQALGKFRSNPTGSPYCGSTDPSASGNGSIMRLCPIPMFFANQPRLAMERAAESSRLTHGSDHCLSACRFMSGLLIGAFLGLSKEELLAPMYSPCGKDYWKEFPLTPMIEEIARGSYKTRQPPVITGSGFVVHTLEAALWAFYNSDNFKDGCLDVVNLGDDADTTAAVYGQIAGAFYGVNAIPTEWRDKLALGELIESMSTDLLALSLKQAPTS